MKHEEFFNFIWKQYPELVKDMIREQISPLLISPHTVEIDASVLKSLRVFTKHIFKIKESAVYQSSVRDQLDPIAQSSRASHSALMSYDFHLTADGPKLIEINTNASNAMTTALIQSATEKSKIPYLEFIKNMFLEERSSYDSLAKNPSILIVDEKPREQKAYFEFLLYKNYFQSLGWLCDIVDVNEIQFKNEKITFNNKDWDLIYNRSTDFYFHKSDHKELRAAYESNKWCITPQPRDYALLADKERFNDLSNSRVLEKILTPQEVQEVLSILEPVQILTEDNREQLRLARKSYFFKPRRSHGGKGVYRGASISQKVFAELPAGETLAQKYYEPPVCKVSSGQEFKYDLRCYVYKDEIFSTIVRLYEGQTTNIRTEGGGLAYIQWKD